VNGKELERIALERESETVEFKKSTAQLQRGIFSAMAMSSTPLPETKNSRRLLGEN
jgi:hypothetical protein